MIATIIIASLTFLGISVTMIVFPNFKIKNVQIDTYWIIALLGAVILLAFSLAPIKDVFHELTASTSVNPIKILVLFFSMTVISIYLDEVGFFRYLAKVATSKAKGNQYVLFFILYGLTAVLTVFTSNDIVILTLTPFICFFCKNTKINPLPYLIGEFAAANTWSMMLIIGNPTNIYLASSLDINFIEYLKVMWLPTLVTGLFEMGLIFLIFFRKLNQKMEYVEDDFVINSKLDLIIGLVALFLCLVFLIISDYIHLEMWLIAASFAVLLIVTVIIIRLITKKNWNYVTSSLKRLPYQLIPFVLSMFVIVVALNKQGISLKIGEFLNKMNPIFSYGIASFISSNVINNIPTSVLFSNIILSSETILPMKATFAAIAGTNIGAFFTPFGALAGIMFTSLIKNQNIKFTFLDFVKYGSIIAIPTFGVCLLMLYII